MFRINRKTVQNQRVFDVLVTERGVPSAKQRQSEAEEVTEQAGQGRTRVGGDVSPECGQSARCMAEGA